MLAADLDGPPHDIHDHDTRLIIAGQRCHYAPSAAPTLRYIRMVINQDSFTNMRLLH